MIYKQVRDRDGQTLTLIYPETEEDQAELARLDAAKVVDTRQSFGDDPRVWDIMPRQEDL